MDDIRIDNGETVDCPEGRSNVYKGEEDSRTEPRTVKEFDKADQPRERALAFGIQTLSTPDLWALVLRAGMPGMPITTICRNIMRDNGHSLKALERRNMKELMKIPGIGETKALQVAAVMELIRRYNLEEADEQTIIKSSQDIYKYLRPEIGNLDHEEIWVLFMARNNSIKSKLKMASGGSAACVFDVKQVIKEALLVGADHLVLCHNHPSGTLRPSGQDDGITRQLKEASRFFDMTLVDHVIISHIGYYSYHDEGRL